MIKRLLYLPHFTFQLMIITTFNLARKNKNKNPSIFLTLLSHDQCSFQEKSHTISTCIYSQSWTFSTCSPLTSWLKLPSCLACITANSFCFTRKRSQILYFSVFHYLDTLVSLELNKKWTVSLNREIAQLPSGEGWRSLMSWTRLLLLCLFI